MIILVFAQILCCLVAYCQNVTKESALNPANETTALLTQFLDSLNADGKISIGNSELKNSIVDFLLHSSGSTNPLPDIQKRNTTNFQFLAPAASTSDKTRTEELERPKELERRTELERQKELEKQNILGSIFISWRDGNDHEVVSLNMVHYDIVAQTLVFLTHLRR